MKFRSLVALVSLCCLNFLLLAFPSPGSAAVISENIELPFRTNHANTFVLQDYAGQIVVLEFFYYWCPHCQAATPKVHTDIVDYYNAQDGNNFGLPVKVVYINLESRSGSHQTGTDSFIAANDMQLVLDDFGLDAFFAYGEPGGTPRFVVINGVANSPSHQQWEVVHQSDGYSPTTTINNLKSKIDSIQAPPIISEITASPTSIDFGVIAVKNALVDLVVLTNHSDVAINNLTATVAAGPFSIVSGATFNIAAFGIVPIAVRFAPTTVGDFNNNVLIRSGGTTFANVAVQGSALTLAQYTAKPTITITNPASKARLGVGTVTVAGTSTGRNEVREVFLQINDGPTLLATGTTAWSREVELRPGLNSIRAIAIDIFNNLSPIIARQVSYIQTSPLSLSISGTGTVTPNLNGQLLEVGRTYSFTAKPGVGQLFAGWSGDISSDALKLTVSMAPNLTLQANFVVNPFVATKGTYNGLFRRVEQVDVNSAGLATFTLADTGKYSARCQIGARRITFTGQFDLEGNSTVTVPQTGSAPLTVNLHLNLAGGDQITGTINSAAGLAELQADRATFSAANPATAFAGKYTASFLSSQEIETTQPAGDGIGTVNITTAGLVTFSGTLADGTKVTQRVPLSKNGFWPLYVPLYRNSGLLFGLVHFENADDDDLSGEGIWIRPAQPSSTLYPGGLTNIVSITGSRYTPPATGTRVLNLEQGVNVLSGGNLSEVVVNIVGLGTNNKVTNLSENSLTLTIAVATGLFSGTVQVPNTSTVLKFNGVLHQKQNLGLGFFLSTGQSGRVYFGM